MDEDVVVAYLNRVAVTPPVIADSAALCALHRAHQVAVPFENLSIHIPEPISLAVRLPDGSGPWLADVGFGSHSDFPLLLDNRSEQDDPAGRFQLADTGHGDVDVLKGGEPQYRIELRNGRSLTSCLPAGGSRHHRRLISPAPPSARGALRTAGSRSAAAP